MRYHCAHCGETYSAARAELGYSTCLPCGEADAKAVKHTTAPLNKSNYVLITDRQTLQQLNPKRTA